MPLRVSSEIWAQTFTASGWILSIDGVGVERIASVKYSGIRIWLERIFVLKQRPVK